MADVVQRRLLDLLPAVAESVSPPSEGAWDVLGVEDGALGAYGLNALTRRLKIIGVTPRTGGVTPGTRPGLPRRALAEGMAAFALVFAGCGAIVAERPVRREPRLGRGRAGVRAGDHGDGVRDRAPLGSAHQPGGHDRVHAHAALPAREAVGYVAAQCLGAAAAALLLAALWTGEPANLGATVPTVGAGTALVYEGVLTAFLMFVIVAVATDTRAVGAAAAIAIGGTVGLDALFGGPVTGASMNPRARSARRWRPASGTTSGST